MKSLKDYLIENENLPLTKKYISVIYDDATQENLRNYCIEHGFDLSKTYGDETQDITDFEFHTTIFYTITEHKLKNEISSYETSQVYPVKFELLGENKDIPVLIVESEILDNIRYKYETDYNMKDKWQDFKPHISLSYNRENIPDVEKLPLPDFELVFDKLKIEDLNEE